MPAQQLRRSEVSLLVVPGGDRLSEFSPAAAPRQRAETQIASPSAEGLIVVRAPLKGLAWRAETEAILSRAHARRSSAEARLFESRPTSVRQLEPVALGPASRAAPAWAARRGARGARRER